MERGGRGLWHVTSDHMHSRIYTSVQMCLQLGWHCAHWSSEFVSVTIIFLKCKHRYQFFLLFCFLQISVLLKLTDLVADGSRDIYSSHFLVVIFFFISFNRCTSNWKIKVADENCLGDRRIHKRPFGLTSLQHLCGTISKEAEYEGGKCVTTYVSPDWDRALKNSS